MTKTANNAIQKWLPKNGPSAQKCEICENGENGENGAFIF